VSDENNAALIDFAGPDGCVYQVTIKDDHSMSINGLIELFLSSGHCVKDDMGNILLSKNGVVKFHWVVPAKAWVKRAPNTIYKTDSIHEGKTTVSSASFDVLLDCLKNM
jgi:hypothetical protein